MAKCDLSIEIQGNEDFVAPGGELDVIVHVSCDSKTKCNGLSLTRSWKTHGSGNRDQGGKRMEELFRGTWEAGEYAYPAKVRFPKTPTSYHGTVLNVDWYLNARADVPLAFDPKAEQMVLVVDPTPPRPYTPPELWAPRPIKLSSSVGCGPVVSLIAMPIALVMAMTSDPQWAFALIPLAAIAFFGFRKSSAAVKAIGQVALEVHPTSVKPGEELHVMVEFEPETPIDLEHMTMTLHAMEEATSGSGTNTTTHRHQAFQLTQVLSENAGLSNTDRLEEEVTFELPVTAPASFDKDDNKVATMLKLEIQPVGKKAVTYQRAIFVGDPKDDTGEDTA